MPPTQLLPPDALEIWLTPPGDLNQRNVLKGHWMDPKVSLQKSPGFLGIVDVGERQWPVGLGLVGRIETAGDATPGFLVPASSVVFQQGSAWAYQKTGAASFQRVLIDLTRPQDSGWFVSGDGFDPKLPLVLQGAQAVLAEQLQAAAGAGEEE